MARLIDADALVEDIKSEIDDDKEIYSDDKTSIMFRAGMKTVIRIVKNQDTVDPVKHGRWIDKPSRCRFASTKYECSVCGKMTWEKYNFCPQCGVRMDGEENDSIRV